jgi:hypothetical protein
MLFKNFVKKKLYIIHMDEQNLDLGCQGYMALQYHMEEALIEANLTNINVNWCPPLAIFSKNIIMI